MPTSAISVQNVEQEQSRRHYTASAAAAADAAVNVSSPLEFLMISTSRLRLLLQNTESLNNNTD